MTNKLSCVAACAVLLAACGGGGGGGGGPNSPGVNLPPTADAGPDQTVVEGDTVNLDGTRSNDPNGFSDIAGYQWVYISGGPSEPSLQAASSNFAFFTADQTTPGAPYVFELTVTDQAGLQSTDRVSVTATDGAPIADAGADQTVVENAVVTLDGTGSTDPNGPGDIVSYLWTYVSGGTGDPGLTNANMAQATFTAEETPSGSPYTFQLTVTDSQNEQSSDQVEVTALAAGSSVVLSGTITYDRVPHNTSTSGLDYNNTVQQPVRAATVQLLSGSSVIDTTTSDDNGGYQFVVTPDSTVRVRVRAELLATDPGSAQWNTRIVDNTSGGALYTLDGSSASVGSGPTQTRDLRALSGWTGSAYTLPRAAGPFAILDDIYGAMLDVQAVDSDVVFPELLVNWSVNNSTASGDRTTGAIGTSFYQRVSGLSNIFVLGAADSDTDEYDDHIIVHEWGHYFEDRLSRSDSIGGPHGTGDRLDMRVAFGEGFGNALSGIITDDPFYRDSFGSGQAQGFFIDVESGSDPSVGWFSEGSVQQILYDLYDDTNDAADQDNITLGFGPLYDVLTGSTYRTSDAWTSIFSFASNLRDAQPAQTAGIDATLDNQNIVSGASLNSFGSNETNNAGNSNDVLPVYTVVNVGTTSGSICSIASFGDINKLSNWRFIRVPVPSAGNYTITVNGGSDPDFVVLQNGEQVRNFFANTGNAGVETDTVTLDAGDASLGIAEFNNLNDGDSGNNGRSCLTVTVTAG